MTEYSISLSDAINNASGTYGVSSALLNAIHALEGNGTSSAGAQGPFQLMPATALGLGVRDSFNPQQAANGAALLVKQNYQTLSTKLGRAPNDFEQYLAYQQGAGGALALINGNPGDAATASLTNAGYGAGYAVKAIGGNVGNDYAGDKSAISTGDFLSYWKGKFDKASGGTSAGGAVASGTTTSGASDSGWSGWASHWIVRVFVFLLGLVFVAAGLVLFGLIRTGAGEAVVEGVAGNLVPRQTRVSVERSKRGGRGETSVAKVEDAGEGLGEYGRTVVKMAVARRKREAAA